MKGAYVELMDHQKEAVKKLDSGKILWGGVGTGKSATVLAYYMEKERPRDIYVITTAKKRDSLDWEKEAAQFGLSTDLFLTEESYKDHYGVLTIDSWNQIGNYEEVKDAFFIFDEQRLVGYGAWVKSFLKIAKNNRWVLLSATPGDSWLDYAPVFIANGHYRNITDFKFKHVLYEPFNKYPKIRGYLGEPILERLRNDILVEMPFLKHTTRMVNYLDVGHDQELCDTIRVKRWNPYGDCPVKDVGDMYRLTKKAVYSDPSRLEMVCKLMMCHNRLIIYYQFDFELEILRLLGGSFFNDGSYNVYEWNGHVKNHHKTFEHEEKWVYLVQYVSGAEAWNCTSTDAMILYSLTYSYKNFEQVQGRIDRLDTPFSILYYYVLMSNIWLDRAVKSALDQKRSFNEREYEENLEDE
jgi:hypothetical protein